MWFSPTSSGYLMVRKKFAPTSSSFSALLLPCFQAFSSAPHVRKCWKTSQRDNTGWLVMWFIHQIRPLRRLEMKSSSKRPVACFSGRWGTEMTGNRSTSRPYSQSKCLYLGGDGGEV